VTRELRPGAVHASGGDEAGLPSREAFRTSAADLDLVALSHKVEGRRSLGKAAT
jgi:hypothetical protein